MSVNKLRGKKAITNYKQALDIAIQINDKRSEGINLGNLGNGYSDLGQFKMAIPYYKESIEIAKQIRNKIAEGINLGNLGDTLSKLKRWRIKLIQEKAVN